MVNITISNKNSGTSVKIELIPAPGASFTTTDSASVISGATLKMCLAAAPPVEPVLMTVSQDPDTWELVINAEPSLSLKIYSPTLAEEIGTFTTDLSGELRVDVNTDWTGWVPDAETIQITDVVKNTTTDFKVRVKTPGWINEYKVISRRLAVALAPESTYEIYNARTNELTNSGTVTLPYSDPYTLPEVIVDIDKTKYLAGDMFKIINKVMVSGQEHAIEYDPDNYYRFVEFTDDQVSELVMDDWYKSTAWRAPFMTIMTPYAKVYTEVVEGTNKINITNDESVGEKEQRVELYFNPQKPLQVNETIKFKMVVAKDYKSFNNVVVDAAYWFAGIPTIGTQIGTFNTSNGIMTTRFLSKVEYLPQVIPATLKSISNWFFRFTGGSVEMWDIVKAWDVSHIENFSGVFYYANTDPVLDLSNWNKSSAIDTTNLGVNSNVTGL